MADLSGFKWGQIVGARMEGASVTKAANIIINIINQLVLLFCFVFCCNETNNEL